MATSKRKAVKNVNIPYKDTLEVKKALLLIAANKGHGKLMWVVRDAVNEYLEKHQKLLSAG